MVVCGVLFFLPADCIMGVRSCEFVHVRPCGVHVSSYKVYMSRLRLIYIFFLSFFFFKNRFDSWWQSRFGSSESELCTPRLSCCFVEMRAHILAKSRELPGPHTHIERGTKFMTNSYLKGCFFLIYFSLSLCFFLVCVCVLCF